MRQGKLKSRRSFVVEIAGRTGGRRGVAAVEQFGEFRRLIDSCPEVNFWKFLLYIARFVPLREAAGNHQTAAFGGTFPFNRFADCRKRLFPCGR